MENYNILSLDGGGVKGLIVLEQLITLERELGTCIKNRFNLISGTSTGGIIAVLLALGLTPSELLKLYTIHSDSIFKKRFLRFGIFRPKYSDIFLNSVIKNYVGDKTLKDLDIDVIITGYNASTNQKIIFKSRNAKLDDTYNYSLFDVIRSSVSAPTYFKPHKIGDEYFIDGGMVINNPSMISWTESLKYCIGMNINILSFSTGRIKINFSKIINGGVLSWTKPTVAILLKEQSKTTDYHMNELFKREPGVYVRCESIIDKSNGKIDDASNENIDNMIADGVKSSMVNYDKIKYFCSKIN